MTNLERLYPKSTNLKSSKRKPNNRSTSKFSFLKDSIVSIKMAKEQNLSLNSAKISGACGKLMCCLRYEYDVYAEENKKQIFTTAKETDANYYAISKLNIPQYNGESDNAIETLAYCENGTFFDKYGNERKQNAIFNGESFAEYVNCKLNLPYTDVTTEAIKAVNAKSTGKVTREEIINASKLFIQK